MKSALQTGCLLYAILAAFRRISVAALSSILITARSLGSAPTEEKSTRSLWFNQTKKLTSAMPVCNVAQNRYSLREFKVTINVVWQLRDVRTRKWAVICKYNLRWGIPNLKSVSQRTMFECQTYRITALHKVLPDIRERVVYIGLAFERKNKKKDISYWLHLYFVTHCALESINLPQNSTANRHIASLSFD